jgi:subtilisin family serine protease
MDSMDKPGPDYVRVLAMLERKPGMQQWLVDLANNLVNNQLPRDVAVEETGLPSEFILNTSFYAVAMGPWQPGALDFEKEKISLDRESLERFLPENSAFFTICGFVKADGPASVPAYIKGKAGESDLTLYSDPGTGASLLCPNDDPLGTIDDARAKLRVDRLGAYGLDGSNVAVAMVDSGIFLQHLSRTNLLTGAYELTRPVPKFPLPYREPIDPPMLDFANSWAPARMATPPGNHRIDHGTMCAYNVLAVAPKATLLDYPILNARPPGDHSVRGTISAAADAYFKLIHFWIYNILAGPAAKYRALVVNNSWTIFHPCEEDFQPGDPRRYIDNLNHPFHRLVWILSQLGADIVFAAGNGGLPCPAPPFLHLSAGSIRGAAAYAETLTVAGCDVHDFRVGYSSQGPAVLMSPGPTPDKPDITAYTHYLGSQVFGEREADGGTSTACPIAAGCIAAIRTKVTPVQVPPAQLFDALRSTGRQGNGGGPGGVYNSDFGYGIIDPLAALQQLGVMP